MLSPDQFSSTTRTLLFSPASPSLPLSLSLFLSLLIFATPISARRSSVIVCYARAVLPSLSPAYEMKEIAHGGKIFVPQRDISTEIQS